eukprot:m.254644 g.254644  ORF g.254644 m.254644 type:complete len:721 (-) comp18355_c0_seq1:279-2441(-)
MGSASQPSCSLLLLGALASMILASLPCAQAKQTVHVVQTCHLDVGFALTAAGELDNYRKYLVEAQNISLQMKQMGNPKGAGLIFTTHPYVVSLLLDCPPAMGFTCPNDQERAAIIAGLQQGNIVMQAFPHNSETATMPSDLFLAAIQLGKDLAAQLNISEPTVLTQRDVPGATRGMIPLLVQAGIKGYSEGVNTASLPPAVPRVFVWRDEPSGTEILASVHPFGYGGISVSDCIIVDGFDHVLCPDYNGDNAGPWDMLQIVEHWQQLQTEFPDADIIPSSFDTYFGLLETVKDKLPVVTSEIADTWIYGIASDPLKNIQYRALTRARTACIADGKCNADDVVMRNFTRLLLKNPEHTWGGDVKTYLKDTTNWLNKDFHALQYTADNFLTIAGMWQEQRDWGLTYSMQAVPSSHPLSAYITNELSGTDPSLPSLEGFTKLGNVEAALQLGGFTVAFNASTGALNTLVDSKGRAWASASNQLGTFEYKIHSATEYNNFFNLYAQRINGQIPSYFPEDFGKPGLYNNPIIANTTIVYTPVQSAYVKNDTQAGEIILELQAPNVALLQDSYGIPDSVWLHYTFNVSSINVSVVLSNKTATRLPESAWFRFSPVVSNSSGWTMDKLADTAMNPLDVVINGSRHLHAIWDGVKHSDGLTLLSPDTPLLSWGDTNPFPTPSGSWLPDLNLGVNFCFFDNIWGTNYIMWVPFRTDEHSYKHRFQVLFE